MRGRKKKTPANQEGLQGSRPFGPQGPGVCKHIEEGAHLLLGPDGGIRNSPCFSGWPVQGVVARPA